MFGYARSGCIRLARFGLVRLGSVLCARCGAPRLASLRFGSATHFGSGGSARFGSVLFGSDRIGLVPFGSFRSS
eukprot:9041023-Pyramimonas_sp.AAC.1